MIIVRLAGGLGNQMFQYAIARSYRRKSSEKIILDIRLLKSLESDINEIIQRPYALEIFDKLKADLINDLMCNILTEQKLIYRLSRNIFYKMTTFIKQESMEHVPLRTIKYKNIYLEGNFQSEFNFRHIREDILKDFTFPVMDKYNESIKDSIIKTNNATSIHIRRGDYLSLLNKLIFASVNINYYKNAIRYMFKRLQVSELQCFVFTDDINWVKENLSLDGVNITFVEGNLKNESWKDMKLMSCCQHHIIANSSFSWWGAWLSERQGINTAPRHWYLPNSNLFDINDIVPESWILIDYEL